MEATEKVGHALTRKVLNHETKLKDRKKNTNICNATNDPKYELSKSVKEKESDTNKDKLGENMLFNTNDLKGTRSTPKRKNYKDSELDLKDELLRCKECKYK